MKARFLISIFFILFQLTLLAQNSGVAVELHYPYVSAKNTNNYTDVNGIFGGTVRFQFTDNDFVNYGISYQFDMNQTYEKYYTNESKTVNFITNHIDGFGKINLDDAQQIQLLLQGGFTFYKYKESNYQPGFTGFNVGSGLHFNLSDQFYIHASYNWVKASIKQKQTEFVDAENFGIVRAGVGFKI